jgi:predicted Zn-dependent protease
MRRIFIFINLFFFLSGCAAPKIVRINEGTAPSSLLSEEEKLLRQSKKFENLLEESGAIYTDKELEGYIKEIGSKIAPKNILSKGINFEFKIIRDPTLNAFALANGKIYLHTGLLARLRNEAQLAFILGHEISHVVNRDLLYFTANYHSKTVVAKVLDLVFTAPTVWLGINSLTNLGLGVIYAASVTGYGRNIEARADREGLEAMHRLKYSPEESVKLFEIFLDEDKKYKKGMEIYFLSSHPSNKRRIAKLKEIIKNNYLEDLNSLSVINKEKFTDKTADVKIYNATLNIKTERLYHALDNLRDIVSNKPSSAKVHFYLGETYRLLSEEPLALKEELSSSEWEKIKKENIAQQEKIWQKKAYEEYKKALEYNSTYAEPYRGLGLLYKSKKENMKAIEYLKKYLNLNPDAEDKRFIESCLRELASQRGNILK